MKDTWIDNPKGYANVLKGTLPFFVLVPAVRDVTEESKGTKSSPFGKLLNAILDTITDEKKSKIEGILAEHILIVRPRRARAKRGRESFLGETSSHFYQSSPLRAG